MSKAAIPVPKRGFVTHEEEARWLADMIMLRINEGLTSAGIAAQASSPKQLYELILLCLGSAGERQAKELQHVFDMRWEADRRAIERWRAAAPGRDLTLPDHTDLVVWLLEQWSGSASAGGGA